ncbi:hypothetical protein Btru_028811 [Bulinus truncatus]|nr:hypothetical protein Btru_028811 [Bulinus truncatus]
MPRGKGIFTELSQFEGEGRQIYKQENAKLGVYLLNITSLDQDSYVKVYLSYSTLSLYPVLPPDPRVDVSINNTLLTLNWPSAARFNEQPIEYCITVNRVKNIHSYCGAMAYLKGDKKPPTNPIWRSSWESEKLLQLKNNSKPLKKWGPKKLFHQCVLNSTSFSYGQVRRGKTYFVDVFVLAKKGNEKVASAYTGTTVKMKRRKNVSTLRMKVGETKTIKLNYQHRIVLYLNTTLGKLSFEVLPCEDRVPVEIHHNGRRIQRKTLVKRWHRRVVHSADPGIYILTFPRIKKKTFVTVTIKANTTRSKIVLPRKFLIKVSKKMTTCSSVHLEWTAANIKQKYCVYHRRVRKTDQLRRRCMSLEKRPMKERVVCFFSNTTRDAESQKMTYDVQGLKPDTRYRFDVFVSRGQSSSVAYKSVTMRTKHCHRNEGQI